MKRKGKHFVVAHHFPFRFRIEGNFPPGNLKRFWRFNFLNFLFGFQWQLRISMTCCWCFLLTYYCCFASTVNLIEWEWKLITKRNEIWKTRCAISELIAVCCCRWGASKKLWQADRRLNLADCMSCHFNFVYVSLETELQSYLLLSMRF